MQSLNVSPAEAAQELLRRRTARNKIRTWFPDAGAYRRELYPRHMEFIELGSLFRERLFMAANRVGKTELGAYETTLHLTGDYPEWWPGRRFDHPVEGWAAGKTNKPTMDIVQEKLLGKEGERGTGMVPADSIIRVV